MDDIIIRENSGSIDGWPPVQFRREFIPPLQGMAFLNSSRKLTKSECIDEFVYHIKLAHFTLDLYMMSVHHTKIVNALLEQKNKNIRIRIVLDDKFMSKMRTSANKLIKGGVEVFWQAQGVRHAYRICLIDCDPVLDSVNCRSICLMTLPGKKGRIVENIQRALIITCNMTILQYHRLFVLRWQEMEENNKVVTGDRAYLCHII